MQSRRRVVVSAMLSIIEIQVPAISHSLLCGSHEILLNSISYRIESDYLLGDCSLKLHCCFLICCCYCLSSHSFQTHLHLGSSFVSLSTQETFRSSFCFLEQKLSHILSTQLETSGCCKFTGCASCANQASGTCCASV